jgi:general secretion pathway protein G
MGAIIIATLFGLCSTYHRLLMKIKSAPLSVGSSMATLIELMVVLLIIGVLAALVVPNVLDRADDARVTAAKTDVTNLMQALKLYKLDNQRYPSAEQGLQALLVKPTTAPVPGNWKTYLDQLPKDPGRTLCVPEPGHQG